jgi:hypothetical protein
MRLGSLQIRWVEATARWVEDHKLVSFGIFSFFYFLGACGKASSKPFWFDELFSWYIAKLPSLSDIWKALYEGIDSQPPLHYFLIRASHWVFGTGEVATRLPFILGFWLALFFLFLLIAKRCGSLMAYLAVVFLCLSSSYQYAYEARPYALVLACCGASLYCWGLAIEGRFRKLALVGLSLSLNVALFSNYYAVLLFLPLIIGEGYRSFRSRRIDWPIWISMVAGGAVLIPLAPMILNYRREFSKIFWNEATRGWFLHLIDWFFHDPALVGFLGVGCLLGVMKGGGSLTVNKRNQWADWNVPSHELIAAIILMLLPVIGFVLAKFVTHAYHYRYFLPTIIGITLGLTFLYHRLLLGRLGVTAILIAFLLGIFLYGQAMDARGLVSKKLYIKNSGVPQVLFAQGDSPIVISWNLRFLPFLHYAPPDLKSRLCYITSLNADDKSATDSGLEKLSERIPMTVVDYQSFLSLHHHFYLYIYHQRTGKILQLLKDGAQLKIKNMDKKGNILLEVSVDSSLSEKTSRSSMR